MNMESLDHTGNFDNKEYINYKTEERTLFRKSRGKETLLLLERFYPRVLEVFNHENHSDFSTITGLNHNGTLKPKNQSGAHFSEIYAMNYFLEKGQKALMIVPAFIKKEYKEIKKIINDNFTERQAKTIFDVKNGGIPDLLIERKGKWQFAEVKTIKYKDTDEHEGFDKKQNAVFSNLRKEGIRIDLVILRPVD